MRTLAEAKANLSRLLDRAARGEEIVIARAGKPLARLMPLESRPKRKFGVMRNRWPEIPDDILLAPMGREELRWAEGYYVPTRNIERRVADRARVERTAAIAAECVKPPRAAFRRRLEMSPTGWCKLFQAKSS